MANDLTPLVRDFAAQRQYRIDSIYFAASALQNATLGLPSFASRERLICLRECIDFILRNATAECPLVDEQTSPDTFGPLEQHMA